MGLRTPRDLERLKKLLPTGGGTSLPDQTGNAGKFLTTNGSATSWGTPAGSGDVVGPAGATSDDIVLFDGATGKLIKDSGKKIAIASGVASLNASTKVVEDPANATATATASKIPIADGSGKLDTWVSANLSSSVGVSVDNEIALYSGTTGRVTKRATTTGILKGTSGVISSGSAGDVDSILPTQTSKSGSYLMSNGSTSLWHTVSSIPIVIQVLTGSGTWTKPSGGQTTYRIVARGAGGGGGGGSTSTGAAYRSGGTGGGGGAMSVLYGRLSELGTTEPYSVGQGGTKGAGNSPPAAPGSPGLAGAPTTFGLSGSIVWVGGGGAGGGGINSSATQCGGGGGGTCGVGLDASTTSAQGGGPGNSTTIVVTGRTGGTGGTSQAAADGQPAEFGGGGGGGQTTTGCFLPGSSIFGSGGGGCGAGTTNAPAVRQPSAGGASRYIGTAGLGGAAGVSGAAPTGGTNGAGGNSTIGGAGGGGGGSSVTAGVSGANGGDGGVGGGGGGGGGAGESGGGGTAVGGDGGNGGNGWLEITCW